MYVAGRAGSRLRTQKLSLAKNIGGRGGGGVWKQTKKNDKATATKGVGGWGLGAVSSIKNCGAKRGEKVPKSKMTQKSAGQLQEKLKYSLNFKLRQLEL